MKSSVATVIPFPQPTKPAPDSADDLARRYLAAKQTIAEAEALVKSLGPKLIAAMQREQREGAVVPGLGMVTRYEARASMRVDAKAAERVLAQHGLDVPYTTSGGGVQLRATLLR